MPDNVEIRIGGVTYELRRYLGWFALEQASDEHNIEITLPGGAVTRLADAGGLQGLDPDTPIGLKMPGPEVALRRLRDRIASWTREGAPTEEAIKRLPPSHVRALLAEIEKLEAAEKEEVAELAPGAPFEKPLRG